MTSMRWIRAFVALSAIVAMAIPTTAAAATPPRQAPAGAFAAPAAPATDPDAVTLTGTLRVAIADDFATGRAQTLYSIDTVSGSTPITVSGKSVAKLNGALVRVSGHLQADGSVAVASGSLVVEKTAAANPDAAALGIKSRAHGTASPAAPTTETVAVIIADYSDLAGYPVTYAQAESTFTSSTASVHSYFDATSRTSLNTTTTVYGPWHLGISQCPGGNSSWSFSGSRTATRNAAIANGVSASTYDSYDHVVLWTRQPCQQGWAGVAQIVGSFVQITVDWADPQRSWDEPALSAMVASHELGHNLGLLHSNGLACFDGSDDQVELVGSCQDAEYWDQYSTMGMAGAPDHALLDANRLSWLGWLSPAESQTVTAAGAYSLLPVYSATTGVRMLRIVRPTAVLPGEQSGAWTLELRSTLTGTAWDQFIGSPYSLVTTGVTIRYSEDPLPQYNSDGYSYLIDTVVDANKADCIATQANCPDFWDAPLQVGQTFSDPIGGFTITVDSVAGSGATVTIGDTMPPSAPLSLEATAIPLPTGGAQLDWGAATDNLGLALYRIYRDGSQIAELSGSAHTYTDPKSCFLGTRNYAVAAVDTAGNVGPQATASAVLVGPPCAPTAPTATAGNAAALVSWTAPGGGATITGYTVTSQPDTSHHCTTTGATSCIVEGLTNGTPYRFAVTATNSAGTGPASVASNEVTPLAVPGRPKDVAGAPGDTTVAVTWTAPDDHGASPITSYVVTASPGGRTCSNGATIGCTVTGLTNGVAYTFTVTAANGLGPGLPSDPSPPATPRTRPNPPVSVTALASNGFALVSWGAPPFDGGSVVTRYDVIPSPGGVPCHTTGARSCTVTGLTNRTWYTFTVTATNVAGTSDPSAASPAAMPLAGATYVTVTPNRLVDSRYGIRLGLSASLSNAVPVSFLVTGRSVDPKLNVPTGAVAVTGNLTAVNEGSSGFFSLTPDAPGSVPTTSTLNFPKGDVRANSVTVPLRAAGKLWITFYGGSGKKADILFDVTGYYVGNTSGATYLPLTPNRVLDSRPAAGVGSMTASLTSGTPASFEVTGQSTDPELNVPSNAIAVVGNLTAVNEGSAGWFSLMPTRPIGVPSTSTINFPKGDVRANGVTIPLGPGGVLWVYYAGKSGSHADVLFDVTGYFVHDTSGATYLAVTPNRLVDSRAGTRQGLAASLVAQSSVHFAVTGQSGDVALNIPSDAVGVTGNLTGVGEGSAGFFAVTPDDPGEVPDTSTLNFPKGDTRANAVTTPLGDDGGLWVTFAGASGAHADVLFDVSGYFTMN